MFVNNDWDTLVKEILTCTKCKLHVFRKNPVPGEGSLKPVLMFVGEAPGSREDEEGRPFVGAAGKLLTELISSIGLTRSEVYITNIVKCRPPNNRDPEDDEIQACSPYLIKQINLLKPKIVVALGRHAARFFFKQAGLKWVNMSVNHGKVHSSKIAGVNVKLIATYHPAAALYNPPQRRTLEKDFELIGRVYKETMGASTKRTLLDFF